jgi:multidrug efflux pump subunit AcrB
VSLGARLFPFLTRYRSLLATLGAVLAVGGLVSLQGLGSGIYPELEFPRIVVVARSGDMPAEQMQAAVVRPLEQALAPVLGVRRIRTRIIRGSAEIALQFVDGSDMWRALQLTDAAIGRARGDLPADTEIESEKITPADFPILSYNLVGGTSLQRREAADFIVLPAFSRVPGVGRVEVVGGDPREIEVVLDPARLAALHLRPSQAADRVGKSLVRRAVGRFDRDRQRVTVTADSVAEGSAVLARTAIASGPNGSISLGDVAQILEGAPDRTRLVHGPEGDAVQISVSRMPGASAPEVVRGIAAMGAALRLPEGIHLREVYNQGRLIEASIAGIGDAILIGILLTVGVLAFFLRDARAGVLAALSVPATLVVTFLAMALLGQSLNLMSLGGMAIAIGLVIDDAIVVIEAVMRHVEDGMPPREAVHGALVEMTGPVIGTTVTTVVVFLPLAFLSGLAGKFFSALAATLATSVLVSMLFALFILPLLAARWVRPGRGARRTEAAAGSSTASAAGAAGAVGAGAFERGYERGLLATLRRPRLAWIALVLVIGVAATLAGRIPSGFLPEMDEGAFVIDYFLPAGTSLQETDAAALRIEEALRQDPAVATWTRRTGAELGPVTATQLNRGDIAVQLVRRSQRPEAEEVMGRLRDRLDAGMPNVRIEFVQILEDVLNDLSGNPRPLEVRILGEDQAVLQHLAEETEKRLDDTPHLVDYYRGVEDQVPLLRCVPDSDAVVRAGLLPVDVADDLETALRGSVVGTVPYLDRLVPVRVRFPDEVRYDPQVMGSLPIALGAAAVPIARLVHPGFERSASTLYRENMSPAALASGDVEGGDLGGLVRAVSARLRGLVLPAGYRLEIGGRAESQARAFREILLVLGLGVLVVFAVLVGQFRSAGAAVLVLLTVPPALGGGILFLAATGVPLNVSSLMGLVLLVGLVVKNGILLVGSALGRLEAGDALHDALRFAGRRRLRPILMTTLCTVFGLMPLAFSLGAGSELQRPLAVAVIGGLLFSTAATLFLLPAIATPFLRGARTS